MCREVSSILFLVSQFSSVAQSCPTLCDPMNRSTPGLPVHHQLLEFTQTHVHWVSDAIQPSHPLLSPSPPAPNPSQHQSLFQWVNSSHEVAKVLLDRSKGIIFILGVGKPVFLEFEWLGWYHVGSEIVPRFHIPVLLDLTHVGGLDNTSLQGKCLFTVNSVWYLCIVWKK